MDLGCKDISVHTGHVHSTPTELLGTCWICGWKPFNKFRGINGHFVIDGRRGSPVFCQISHSGTVAKRALGQQQTPTYLAVPVTFMLSRVRLAQFILELSVQIILRVHNIQVLVLVPVPFVLLILAGAADVIEDLPQFVTLSWPCERSTLMLYI